MLIQQLTVILSIVLVFLFQYQDFLLALTAICLKNLHPELAFCTFRSVHQVLKPTSSFVLLLLKALHLPL